MKTRAPLRRPPHLLLTRAVDSEVAITMSIKVNPIIVVRVDIAVTGLHEFVSSVLVATNMANMPPVTVSISALRNK